MTWLNSATGGRGDTNAVVPTSAQTATAIMSHRRPGDDQLVRPPRRRAVAPPAAVRRPLLRAPSQRRGEIARALPALVRIFRQALPHDPIEAGCAAETSDEIGGGS